MKKAILKYGLIAGVALILLAAVFLLVFFNRNVAVPEVTGKNISEATALLADAKFTVQTNTEYSDTVSKDCVISQDIAGGTKAKYGSEITLIVSKGKEQITLPDVKNCAVEEAEASLKQLGFSVVIKENFSDTIVKGNVISQSVRAGKQADKGATITLTVSKGPDIVVVPNIQGKTLKEAEQILKAVGLRFEADIQCSDSVKEGVIISQDVGADEQVKRNTAVCVKISAGVANKVGTTPSNARHFGKVTSQGDWIYFAGEDAIYRMRKDKSETQRISSRGAVSLNVVGEWLYYTDGGAGGLYKVKIDGTGETKISNITSYKVYVEGEWIYYTSNYAGGQIYKMKTDGSSVTKITEDSCSEYIVNGQYIYYVNPADKSVYKCSIDGTGKTILCPGFNGMFLALVGDKLVIVDKYTIQSVNLDGSGFTSFGTNNVQPSFLNGYDGWVYYLEHDFRNGGGSTSFFCRVKPDGSQKTKIYAYDFLNHANTYLNVLDDWIYFQNEHKDDTLYRVNIDSKKVERVG